jgi:hypothetical protein
MFLTGQVVWAARFVQILHELQVHCTFCEVNAEDSRFCGKYLDNRSQTSMLASLTDFPFYPHGVDKIQAIKFSLQLFQ